MLSVAAEYNPDELVSNQPQSHANQCLSVCQYTLRKKGPKAVTWAVPFQKGHFCTLRLHIGTLVVQLAPKMYKLGPKIDIRT